MSKIGDTKKKLKFALLPKAIGGKIIWFRRYEQHYIYKECKDVDEMNTFYFDKWVETHRKLL